MEQGAAVAVARHPASHARQGAFCVSRACVCLVHPSALPTSPASAPTCMLPALQVGVRSVVMRGKGRIICTPLLNTLPVVGGLRVSLMGPPQFSYKTKVFGGNPFFMPGLEAWLK